MSTHQHFCVNFKHRCNFLFLFTETRLRSGRPGFNSRQGQWKHFFFGTPSFLVNGTGGN